MLMTVPHKEDCLLVCKRMTPNPVIIEPQAMPCPRHPFLRHENDRVDCHFFTRCSSEHFLCAGLFVADNWVRLVGRFYRRDLFRSKGDLNRRE